MGSASTFISSRFLLFFFLPAFVDFGRQFLLLWTVYTLFTHCAYTVHVLKNIKNGSHDTIYTFKYYFVTVFSATISSIQTHPKIYFILDQLLLNPNPNVVSIFLKIINDILVNGPLIHILWCRWTQQHSCIYTTTRDSLVVINAKTWESHD